MTLDTSEKRTAETALLADVMPLNVYDAVF